MKKVAIGCAILVAVLAVGAGIGLYVLSAKVGSTVKGFAELGTIPDLERSVRNQEPYQPPASGEVTPSQVQRLLEVQQTVRARLGARMDEMEREYHALLQKDSATITDAPELLSAYRDLASAFVDAKRAQVEALNQAGLSLDEYRWVRRQVYTGLGVPLMEMDMAQLITDIRSGRSPTQPVQTTAPAAESAPPANKKLVEPHRKAFEDNAALAFFGL